MATRLPSAVMASTVKVSPFGKSPSTEAMPSSAWGLFGHHSRGMGFDSTNFTVWK